jgi:hypothetical protein
MTQFRSIIDTHNEMLKMIPENKKQLLCDLIQFINKVKMYPVCKLTTKHIHSDYLRVLLKHIPNRPLKLSDPDWMWNCQEVFSSSIIISNT